MKRRCFFILIYSKETFGNKGYFVFQMIVEEMNILTTVFLRYDNQKIIYPNSLLATKPISNIYRSPDMGDAIDFCVHVSTPVHKLAIMKEKIEG